MVFQAATRGVLRGDRWDHCREPRVQLPPADLDLVAEVLTLGCIKRVGCVSVFLAPLIGRGGKEAVALPACAANAARTRTATRTASGGMAFGTR